MSSIKKRDYEPTAVGDAKVLVGSKNCFFYETKRIVPLGAETESKVENRVNSGARVGVRKHAVVFGTEDSRIDKMPLEIKKLPVNGKI